MYNLWLDLGNTRLKYWLSDRHGSIVEHAAELHLHSPADLLLGLSTHLQSKKIESVGVSSVLDTTTNLRIEKILSRLNAPIHFAKVHAEYAGLITGYEEPYQLGIDRWLQVLAMTKHSNQYCIVGCGTALTIDLLDHHMHLGGYILPSLYLQRDALTQGTKGIKIPEKSFDNLHAGRNTSDAVHHGILLGLLGAIHHILNEYPEYKLVLTGGDASTFMQYLSKYQPQYQPDLLLLGLQHYVFSQA